MRPDRLFIWFALLIFCSACKSEQGEKIVSFGNNTLYEKDVKLFLGKTEYTNEELEEVVAAWLKTQMGATLWDSLPEDVQYLVDIKTSDYRSSMIAFEWENSWIEKRLDTVVTEKEMQQYYKNNISDFLLDDFIVRLLYLKVPDMAPDTENIRQLYLLKKPSDTAKITQYANQYAGSFYFNKDNWISFEDFLKELPVDFIDVERFVTNKTKQVFQENGYLYFINILDYRLKNTSSPFSYEKEKIRSRILLNRKLELRESAKQLFEQKLKQNDEIQYFNP